MTRTRFSQGIVLDAGSETVMFTLAVKRANEIAHRHHQFRHFLQNQAVLDHLEEGKTLDVLICDPTYTRQIHKYRSARELVAEVKRRRPEVLVVVYGDCEKDPLFDVVLPRTQNPVTDIRHHLHAADFLVSRSTPLVLERLANKERYGRPSYSDQGTSLVATLSIGLGAEPQPYYNTDPTKRTALEVIADTDLQVLGEFGIQLPGVLSEGYRTFMEQPRPEAPFEPRYELVLTYQLTVPPDQRQLIETPKLYDMIRMYAENLARAFDQQRVQIHCEEKSIQQIPLHEQQSTN